jgi:hypothetical protein
MPEGFTALGGAMRSSAPRWMLLTVPPQARPAPICPETSVSPETLVI